jgi:hypothetical protein
MTASPKASVQIPTIWGHTDVCFYDDRLTINQRSVPYVSIQNYSLAQTLLRVNFAPMATSFRFHIWTDTDTHDLYWNTLPFNAGGRSKLLALEQLNDNLRRHVLPTVLDNLLNLHKQGKPLKFRRVTLEPSGMRLKNSWEPSGELVPYNMVHFEQYGPELRLRASANHGNNGFIINFADESAVLPVLLSIITKTNA